MKPSLADLGAFAAIAAHRSFRKVADELGLSPSTLSHLVRTLEGSLGVRLLNRTTRSVSPTEAGERLLAGVRPLLHDFDRALDAVEAFRGRASGTLRINANETAVQLLLRDAVPAFLQRHPDVALDLVTEGRLIDIVAEGFDAGIRLGESVPQDMVAVRFGGTACFLVVASPTYLASRGTPATPDDLAVHACIRHRLPSGKLYRWEFEHHGQEMTIDAPGVLTLDHAGLMADAAAQGLGIAYVAEHVARPYLDEHGLVAILSDWCPPVPGLFLYYPGHRQVPGALRAFIDVLTSKAEATGSGARTAPQHT